MPRRGGAEVLVEQSLKLAQREAGPFRHLCRGERAFEVRLHRLQRDQQPAVVDPGALGQ